jgi:2,4-dienoyl-CoA reductase-like NADH-dependent reductase (Old Yellow Enzyme family)
MAELFESTVLNGMVLRNRFVHSATNEGMANADGSANERLIRWQEEVAEGEVGLVIPGNAFVSNQGKSRPGQMGVHNDETVPGLSRMAEAVHKHGSRIALQLTHAGGNMYVPSETGTALGPSDMKLTELSCRAMTKEDIDQTVTDFAQAAARARRAGCDAVQLHGAHSYLISQFLSPYFNHRTDEYGGSLENRARFAIEVLRAVRSAVGPDFPVLIKINSEDFLENGFALDDMVPYALMLESEGIDAIEISGGTHFSDPRYFCSRPTGTVPKGQEIYFKEAAELYKREVKVPLILVGGVRSLGVAEGVVKTGLADYVALCRPLIREPDLVKRWRLGDVRPSTCISCNLCFRPVRAGEGVYCVSLERQRRRKAA